MVRKTPSRSQRVAKGPHKGPKRAKKMPRGTQRVAKEPQKGPKWLQKPSKIATKSTILRGLGAWALISQKVMIGSCKKHGSKIRQVPVQPSFRVNFCAPSS